MDSPQDDTHPSIEGGPGWRVREPAQRVPRPDPIEVAPPPLPPAATSVIPASDSRTPPSQRRFGVAVYAIAGIALFAVAGGGALLLAGGTSGSSPGAPLGSASTDAAVPANIKSTLLSSIRRTETMSVRADITMQETFNVSNATGGSLPGLQGGGEIAFTIHVDQESAQRAELQETVTAPGLNQKIISVLYDGRCYVSSDDGATYQTVPLDIATSHQLSPKTPLQFLQMIGEVSNRGDADLNGQPVVQYHADLDPVKVTAYFKAALAAEHNPFLAQIARNTGITDGSLDTWLDGRGRIAADDGSVDEAINLGAFNPRSAGSTLDVGVSFRGAFTDYGSPITVQRPGVVTGTTILA
jgi:hypothetical protein